jgi:hypothetical protein
MSWSGEASIAKIVRLVHLMVNFGDLANSTRARVKFRWERREIQEQMALPREARWPELGAATIGV